MNGTNKWLKIAGWVLHGLIAAMMILFGSMKILGLFPPEAVEHMGLAKWILVIGIGEVTTAVLLLVPRTLSLGVLLISAFWGGAICIHMSHDEPFIMQSALLVLSWVGAYLRNPATFSSFFGAPATTPRADGAAVPALR